MKHNIYIDKYLTLRNNIFCNLLKQDNVSHTNLMCSLMYSHIRKVAKYIVHTYRLRRKLLYS